MTPHRSAPGSPSKASELDLIILKIVKIGRADEQTGGRAGKQAGGRTDGKTLHTKTLQSATSFNPFPFSNSFLREVAVISALKMGRMKSPHWIGPYVRRAIALICRGGPIKITPQNTETVRS